MRIFDGHLDLAMNAVHWNRDLKQPLHEIREREKGQTDRVDRGCGTVSLPEMRRGEIFLCVATQIGHSVSRRSPLQGWHSPEIAWAQTQAQLAWYQSLVELGELTQIRNQEQLKGYLHSLDRAFSDAQDPKGLQHPIGFILSLEGADSILSFAHLEKAFDYGLRIIGPAHYGPGIYAAGTGETDGLTHKGRELLKEMERLGVMLDLTHLTDVGFDEALDIFGGPIWASHSNCRKLVPSQRQWDDKRIRQIIERDGIIGAALDAWMIVPDWVRGESTPKEKGVTLNTLIDHIDHVCQIAGNCNHVCIGSDLDGGYGTEQTPIDVNSIADLQRLESLLQIRGYPKQDVAKILFENALRHFQESLPKQ